MPGRFEGKVAIVTGGGAGIGRSSALAFAKEGAAVAVADISDEGGRETVRAIEEAGGKALFINADVSKASDVQAMCDKTLDRWGRLDYAHNNVGRAESRTTIVDLTEEVWDWVINVSLKSVWLSMKYEIPHMLKSGGGAIVNTSSFAGLHGSPEMPTYVSAKHGVIGLTKAAALGYAKQGIRVNAVCPGPIRTPALEWWFSEATGAEEEMVRGQIMGRLGKPEEVAAAVLWLCSDEASFVNGHALVIDGGNTAG